MLFSTRGIVIRTTKFSETSLVARIFTEQFGMQSYIIKGIRRSQSKLRSGLFQPLALLDLEVYHKQKNTLHSIREAGYSHPYQTLPFDIRKSSIAFFIQELTYKTIREEEPNHGLFKYLYETCVELDNVVITGGLFPILFSLHLTKHLGFVPQNNYSESCRYFNLKEGLFQETMTTDGYSLDDNHSLLMSELLKNRSLFHEEIKIPSAQRSQILEKILTYYKLHLPGFEGLKSHLVLHTVLS